MDTEKSGQTGHERDQEPVPRLPRSAGFRVSWPAVFRILMFAALLVGVIMLREPCASSVASFVGQFNSADQDAGADASAATGAGNHGDVAPDERLPPGTYVHITGDMSEEEIANALRQAGVEQPGPGDAGVTDAPPLD